MRSKCISGLLIVALLSVPVFAADLWVPGSYPTIQAAINAAGPTDTVVILDGTYSGLGNYDINFGGKAITVRSESGDPSQCIIDCQQQGRGFVFESGEGADSVLQGVTITNGLEYYGGGIECEASSPTIRNCVIVGNTATIGGGIDCFMGSPTIFNCVISDNVADGAFEGDGDGGGIECESSSAIITNCLIRGNNAGHWGGGVDCLGSQAIITNCTIVDNVAPRYGGICADATSSLTAVVSSILWNNGGEDITGATSRFCCVQDGSVGEGNNISVDPRFREGPLSDYYGDYYGHYYLSNEKAGQSTDSPCIDAGDPGAGDPNAVRVGLGLDTFSTRTDNEFDEGRVDIGYHYPGGAAAVMFDLTTAVVPGANGMDNGTITPDSGSYVQFAEVSLLADPNLGYKVKSWNGTDDDSTTSTMNMVTMTGNKAVTVEFREHPMVTLTTSVVGGEGTIMPLTGLQYLGDDVLVTATPANDDYRVGAWTGTVNDDAFFGQEYAIVTMDSDKTVTVEFISSTNVRLDAMVIGGHGYVEPRRVLETIDFDPFDNPIYPVVNLTATPDRGWKVYQWNGSDEDTVFDPFGWTIFNTAFSVPVTLDYSKTVTVQFEPAAPRWLHLVAYSPDGFEHGEVIARLDGEIIARTDDPFMADNVVVYENDLIELNATPEAGYELVVWYQTDDDSSDNPNNSVTIQNDDVRVIAEFRQIDSGGLQLADGMAYVIDLNGDTLFSSPKIQEAIDEAIGLINIVDPNNTVITEVVVADGTFTGTGNYDLNLYGAPIVVRSLNGPENCIINCWQQGRGFIFHTGEQSEAVVRGFTIRNGFSDMGGGLYFAGTSAPTVEDCVISNCSSSDGGGGVYFDGPAVADDNPFVEEDPNAPADADPGADPGADPEGAHSFTAKLVNCQITSCSSIGPGGGIFIDAATPLLLGCDIRYNNSGVGAMPQHGGGIYCRELSAPVIINCLITYNNASYYGGAIYLKDSPAIIRLCTIVGNYGTYDPEIDDDIYLYGAPQGGIRANGEDENDPEIDHCIIWGNYDDLEDCEATYSCIEDGDGGDGNFDTYPLFVTGSLGTFYLSQIEGGQRIDSPCIDAGENEDILGDLQEYYGLEVDITTSIMGNYDIRNVDVGYHYPIFEGPPMVYKVAMNVVGNGSMSYDYYSSTAGYSFEYGEVYPAIPVVVYVTPGGQMSFTAVPDQGYRVLSWTGTDDDDTFSVFNLLFVRGDTIVTLEFEESYIRTLNVPGNYTFLQIQNAINDARDGDTIVLHNGVYTGIGLDIVGKNITLTSAFPNDPDYVANTIFDFSRVSHSGIYVAGTGTGSCVLNGITITGSFTEGRRIISGPNSGDHGSSGSDFFGGGLIVDGDHIIANCVIRDCWLRGYHGAHGNDGDDDDVNGGRGGNGGSVGGAGLYIGSPYNYGYYYEGGYSLYNGYYYNYSTGSPLIQNCTITGCTSIAGSGGNGGDAADGVRAGDGGVPGRVMGGGVYISAGTRPTFVGCTIADNEAVGNLGASGGNATGVKHFRPGWGGLTDIAEDRSYYYDIGDVWAYDAGDSSHYTACGGGIYIGGWGFGAKYSPYYYNPDYYDPDYYDFRPQTKATFIDCQISGNITRGSVSGRGGEGQFVTWMPPHDNYQIPSYGAGVYVAEDANAIFVNCNIRDNQALDNYEYAAATWASNSGIGFDYYRPDQYIGYGGGVCIQGLDFNPYAHFDACHIAQNYAAVGGGMYWTDSQLDVADSNVIDNQACIGGGIYLIDSFNTQITRSLIQGNSAEALDIIIVPEDPNAPEDPEAPGFAETASMYGLGGGIYGATSQFLVQDCVVRENLASGTGGGVYLMGHTESISPLEAIPVLDNCLITDNEAFMAGGGVAANWYVTPEIANCTIADNVVTSFDGYGGGIYCGYGNSSVVHNSIIRNNAGVNGSQIAVTGGGTNSPFPSAMEISYSNIQSLTESLDETDTTELTAIRSGFDAYSLAANDDGSTPQVDIGFDVNFYGRMYNQLFVNNNGNVTFDSPMSEYTPSALIQNIGTSVIAPFFADVDTLGAGSSLVTYGTGLIDGRAAFGVNWVDVGYFASHADKLNSFQLIIVDRSDRNPGDIDMEFNYSTINWETGDASLGINGFGGYSARAGYSNGSGQPETFFEFEGSGVNGAFLDSSLTGLIHGSRNSNRLGRYIFFVFAGMPESRALGIPIYVEEGSTLQGWDPNTLWASETNNIIDDPNFIGGYYLSQIAAGQLVDSNSVDAGSGLAKDFGLVGKFTTRTDGVGEDPDSVVDMGYHYSKKADVYSLWINILGGEFGTVSFEQSSGIYDPISESYMFPINTVVKLIAQPQAGYRVRRWYETNDVPAWQKQYNSVYLDSNRTITVEFELNISRNLLVPEVYGTIEEAVEVSSPGDNVVIAPGMHYITDPGGIDFNGRNITIMSTDPDDPTTIAATIIDCQGTRNSLKRAFHFHSGEDNSAKLYGLTIENGYVYGARGMNGALPGYMWPPAIPPNYQDLPVTSNGSGEPSSGNGYGGAILCEDGSSPTIENCVFNNCTVTGAQGGDGADGWPFTDPPYNDKGDAQPGGHGGNGQGNGYGGAICAVQQSNPVIVGCTFDGNIARGGMGGDGGDCGLADGGHENIGGNGGDAIGYGRGGALYFDRKCLPIIRDCTFIDNIATSGKPGSGGSMTGGTEWGDNWVAHDGSDGWVFHLGGIRSGAIFYGKNCDADITDSNFVGNGTYESPISTPYYATGTGVDVTPSTVGTYGGAIFSDPNNLIVLKNCEFRENIAGAVYANSHCWVDVDNCSFIDNINPGYGLLGDSYYYSSYYYSSYYGYGVPIAPLGIAAGGLYIGSRCYEANVTNCDFRGNYSYADGGAVSCKSDATFTQCSFSDNAANGYGGAFFGYDDVDPNVSIVDLDFQGCVFVDNKARYGGGLYGREFDAKFNDCYFITNEAETGGGLCLADGTVSLDGGLMRANRAISDFSLGGGMACVVTTATIENFIVEDNVVEGDEAYGGGIMFYGADARITQTVKNSLFTGNRSSYGGGAIGCNIFVETLLDNCTFADNTADEFGGAVFCDWSSYPKISNSIFAGNDGYAIYEEQIGGDSQVTFSLFNNNPDGDIYDAGTGAGYTGATAINTVNDNHDNTDGDPLFEAGVLGSYYLNSLSPAVNAGGALSVDLGLNLKTTQKDNTLDDGTVDLGYHYTDYTTLETFQLTVSVIGGHGSVIPAEGTYYSGQMVTLTAIPEASYNVEFWAGGTLNDNSVEITNVVIMNADRHITVQFRLPRLLVVGSSAGDYTSIQEAIDKAEDGDIVRIEPGRYTPVSFDTIRFLGKNITLTGANPDDPETVAATVLVSYDFSIADVGSKSVIEGLTIQSGRISLYNSKITIRNCNFIGANWHGGNGLSGEPCDKVPSDGYNGGSIYGGVIHMIASSPTILNCRFEGSSVTGGDGGRGSDGCDSHPDGWDGGWSGRAYGGAVYCGYDSNPYFLDCEFIDCFAQGGNGGDGGDGKESDVDYGGRGGNWIWADSLEDDYFSWWWDGWEFGDRYTRYGIGGYMPIYGWDRWSKWFGLEEFLNWEDWLQNYVYDPYETAYDDYWRYSGYGGAVFCEFDSSPEFEGCLFEDNHSYGGVSGIGGYSDFYWRWPDRKLNIENGGGAIFATRGCNLKLVDCVIRDNSADPSTIDVWPDDYYVSFGGGVGYTDDCSMEAINTTFENNQAAIGGGLYTLDSQLDVADCNFIFNSAYHGAGLYTIESVGVIAGSYVENNFAAVDPALVGGDPGDPTYQALPYDIIFGHGGGYYSLSSLVEVTDTIFTANRASGSGGGIYYIGSNVDDTMSPRLHNSLLYENIAGRDGGGISARYVQPIISSCTITNNFVDGSAGADAGYGGGLYASYGSIVDVIDSIIWGNVAVGGSQIAVDSGGSRPSVVKVTYSDVGPAFDPNAVDEFNIEGAVPDGGAGSATLIDSTAIAAEFDAGAESVKVIVTLKQPTVLKRAVDWNDLVSVGIYRDEIAYRIDSVLAALAASEFTLKYRYQNIAGFSVDVTQVGLDALLSNSAVAHIEPVRYAKPMLAQSIPLANATQARAAYDGSGVAIAIVDTGIDYTHPMLGGGAFPNDKVIGGYDTFNNDADPMPGTEAHGTCCAGIAAGDLGIVGDYIGGVAYGAKLYALKASPDDVGSFPTDATLAAWDWCITNRDLDPANPIKVISNSWALYSVPFDNEVTADAFSPAHTILAAAATEVGITITAASGNDGFAGQGISWPSAMSNIISVGAVYDTTDEVTVYSNTDELLDILAPADPMYTTDIVGLLGYDAGDYFPNFNGTSSACPFAAGCIASIQNAALSKLGRYLIPSEVRSLLVATGRPVTDTKVSITKPRVDLGMAIANLVPIPIYVEEGSSVVGWDPNSKTWDDDTFNIGDDPLFIGQEYFLCEIAAGQLKDSPCIDIGSADANEVGLDMYTTRSDSVPDGGIVNLGRHVKLFELEYFVLRTNVNAFGLDSLYGYEPQITPHDPNGLRLKRYTQVFVEVTPSPPFGYEVVWTGTDDDTRGEPNNAVTMDSNKAVLAEFVKIAFELTTKVTVDANVLPDFEPQITPPSGLYEPLEAVELHVTEPPAGFQVRWSGTDNDTIVEAINSVVMNHDREVSASYEPVKVDYYAVVVGINDYAGQISDLNYAAHDASQIYQRLLNSGLWQAENVALLVDSDATKTRIREAFLMLSRQMDLDDVFVFYFAGHGFSGTDMLPIDEFDAMDEYLLASEGDSIRDDEMADWIRSLPTRKYVVLLDTGYHSQPAHLSFIPRGLGANVPKPGDGFGIDLVPHETILPDGTIYTSDPSGMGVVVTAASAEQAGWEYPEIGHGLFTYQLLKAMDGLADRMGNEDLFVSGEECYDFARDGVEKWLADLELLGYLPDEVTQEPQIYDAVEADDMDFVTVPPAGAPPETYYVPGDADTIQEAINRAREGDVIILWPDTYYGTSIIVDKNITITSTNPDDPDVVASTIINIAELTGQSGDRYSAAGVYFTRNAGPGAVLSGVTIQNLNLSAADEPTYPHGENIGGGGIVVGYGASPTIKNCVVQGITLNARPGDGGIAQVISGDAYDGGWAIGAGIICGGNSRPTIENTIVRDCHVIAGDGGNGAGANQYDSGGRGGWPGRALGGGVYIAYGAEPVFRACTITNCSATGANGGNGGDSAIVNGIYMAAGYGGAWSDDSFAPWQSWGYIGDYRFYSAYGGGLYCEEGSSPEFIECDIIGNSTQGGISGLGGAVDGYFQDRPKPHHVYEISSYGGGVYCAAESNVSFVKCRIVDNVAPAPAETYTLNSYLGHGGGIAFEQTESISFEGCAFIGNEAAVGGAVYWLDAHPQISDSNFLENTALFGAGIYANGGSGKITKCLIGRNLALTMDGGEAPVDETGCGGGIFGAGSTLDVSHTQIMGNQARTSGGGIYLTGTEPGNPTLLNCLVTGNYAGRDGGGISVNWQADPLIANSTITNNTATGLFGATPGDGLGGGLFCGYDSNVEIIDSIFWDNSADFGRQIVVGTGFVYDPRPSVMTVSYSNIQNGLLESGVLIEEGCTFNWDQGTTSTDDPKFVVGPFGEYYLSQIVASDIADPYPVQSVNSPCVDTGSVAASSIGLDKYTTRTDDGFDTMDRGTVDRGYHYPLLRGTEPCSYCDLPTDGRDGYVNLADFAEIAFRWLDSCSIANGWCDGSDINSDSMVNLADLVSLTACWLVEDNTGPIPDPSEWGYRFEPAPADPATLLVWIDGKPRSPRGTDGTIDDTAAAMAATRAKDSWGWSIAYQFECTNVEGSGLPGHISPWMYFPNIEDVQPEWTDTGLTYKEVYTYVVRAAEIRMPGTLSIYTEIGPEYIGLVTADSIPVTVMVGYENDQPTSVVWDTLPTSTSTTSLEMVAAVAADQHGPIEYRFIRYLDAAATVMDVVSGWLQDTDPGADNYSPDARTFEDTGLVTGQAYTYRFEVRDTFDNRVESLPAVGTPLVPVENLPPDPDPAQFDQFPQAIDGGDGFWYHIMSAVQATDPEGTVVEYRFVSTDGDIDSDWHGAQWTDAYDNVLEAWEFVARASGQFIQRTYTVTARDTSPQNKETAPSAEATSY